MAKVISSPGGQKGGAFAKGGSGHMVGKTGAVPRTPAKTAGESKGTGPGWATGGSQKMSPNRGSNVQVGGRTSAY